MALRAPEKAVKLTIPEFCRMRGVFNSERDIQITLGRHADGATSPVRIVKPGPSHVPDIGEDSAFIAELRYVKDHLGPYEHSLRHGYNAPTPPADYA